MIIVKLIAGVFYLCGLFGLGCAVHDDPALWGRIAEVWLVEVAPIGTAMLLAYVLAKHLIRPIGSEFSRVRGF